MKRPANKAGKARRAGEITAKILFRVLGGVVAAIDRMIDGALYGAGAVMGISLVLKVFGVE